MTHDNKPEDNRAYNEIVWTFVLKKEHVPAGMTDEEFAHRIRMGFAEASFRSLRNQFTKAAVVRLNQHLEGLDETSTQNEIDAAKKISRAAFRLALNATFYRAALAVTTSLPGLNVSVRESQEHFNNKVANQAAVLLTESLGEREASKLIPQNRVAEHALISAEFGMNELESLIRRSLAPL